jgi:hypothetical protein
VRTGRPTDVIAPHRRHAEFITSIPKPRKQTVRQEDLLDESWGFLGVASRAIRSNFHAGRCVREVLREVVDSQKARKGEEGGTSFA